MKPIKVQINGTQKRETFTCSVGRCPVGGKSAEVAVDAACFSADI